MDLSGIVEKTLEKCRGYVYGRSYRTIYENNQFSLEHYGTSLIKLDIKTRKIIGYYNSSVSDASAISKCMCILEKNGYIQDYSVINKLLVKEFEGLFIPHLDFDKFIGIYNSLSEEHKKELKEKMNDIPINRSIEYIEKFIEGDYSNFILQANKFIKHSKSIRKKIDLYKKSKSDFEDKKEGMKLGDGYLIPIKKKDHWCYTYYFINSSYKIYYLNNINDLVTGRIITEQRFRKKDMPSLREFNIERFETELQDNILKFLSKINDIEFYRGVVKIISASRL